MVTVCERARCDSSIVAPGAGSGPRGPYPHPPSSLGPGSPARDRESRLAGGGRAGVASRVRPASVPTRRRARSGARRGPGSGIAGNRWLREAGEGRGEGRRRGGRGAGPWGPPLGGAAARSQHLSPGTESSQGCRDALGNAKTERHLPVKPLLARAATRLRPPRATRLGPASSHLAGLAAGPLEEAQASRDVAAPGLSQPGGWGRKAGPVIQPDLRPGIDERPLGQWTVLTPSAAAATKAGCCFLPLLSGTI